MAATHPLIRHFTFSLLPAAASKPPHMATLDLISKLSSPLPPPKQPTAAAAAAAAEKTAAEEMPDWVAKILVDKRATFAWKVMEKEIFVSDASDQQNRFMIRKHIVDSRILPAMTDDEMAAANLISAASSSSRRRLCGGGEAGERKVGREHGGLEVMVYNRKGWGCSLYLTRWDAIKASVLKGPKYREFHRRSYFAVGDQVEMWAFRDGDAKLCFVIGSKIDLDISL